MRRNPRARRSDARRASGQARADDAGACRGAVVEDAPQQRRPHAAALRRRVDGEHAELGLVGAGDLAERPAVGHEGHRAEHPVAVGGDQELRRGGARRDVAQGGAVVAVAGHQRRVRRLAEVGDRVELRRYG